jgi:hypothetical protein
MCCRVLAAVYAVVGIQSDRCSSCVILIMKQIFSFPGELSDRRPFLDKDIEVVVLGADLLEKSITSDRFTCSVKHFFFLKGAEPAALLLHTRHS